MASTTNSWASGNAGTGSQEVANNLLTAVANYVWNTSSLTWVTETQPGGGGGGGSNAAAGLTGSAVPTSADYVGFNVGGNLVGVSSSNPLPVSASISFTDPAESVVGAATPTSAIQLGWNNGNITQNVTPTNALPISVNAANFIFSSANSSTTQLAASATFTGTIETALNQPEISLLMTCDQPVTLTVNQFIDSSGVYAVTPVVFTIAASVQFSRSFPLNGNYVQVTVKNTGASTTTTFNLNTAYGTIGSSDSAGNTPVSGTVAATQLGTWNIGSITTLPSLVAGSAIIGSVKLMDTAGTNVGTIKAASTAAAFTDTAVVIDNRPGTAMLTASAALADALANPTLGQQAVLPSVFNGTTWDRARGGIGVSTTTGDTGAKTATGNGATQTNVGYKGVSVVIVVGTVSGTLPTCVFNLQSSVDGGTNWVNIPNATTASLTASGTWGITVYPGITVTAGTTISGTKTTASDIMTRTWRVVWTIGGTTPSFTITSITFSYIN